jgi:hypothetical protein
VLVEVADVGRVKVAFVEVVRMVPPGCRPPRGFDVIVTLT